MEDSFRLEIISPEKTIFSDDVKMTTLPSYEGDMSILKNHISIITFLRPGLIKVKKKDEKFDDFFVEDGTIEYFDNSLSVLSTSATNIKDLSREYLDKLTKDAKEKLDKKEITDHERYILNHKLEVIKEIKI